MTDIELLPCPFCGGRADFEEGAQTPSATKSVTWSVGCQSVDVDCIAYRMLASFDRKSDAAAAWNTRNVPPATSNEAQRLRNILHTPLSSVELKLVDKHCHWLAFTHAWNAVIKHRLKHIREETT